MMNLGLMTQQDNMKKRRCPVEKTFQSQRIFDIQTIGILFMVEISDQNEYLCIVSQDFHCSRRFCICVSILLILQRRHLYNNMSTLCLTAYFFI